MRNRLYGLFFTLICLNASAQQKPSPLYQTNFRGKWIVVKKESVLLDTLSIVPYSFVIKNIPDSSFQLDWVNAKLTWKHKPLFDSVWVNYRVMPGKMNAFSHRMLYDSVMFRFMAQPFQLSSDASFKDDRFFDFGNLNYSGSFGRGLSFGNSQDAVLQSNLNLRLSGYLSDSVEILAAITDNNLPIQPDGTTQQLNEFDQIYLRFRKQKTSLSLGDIEIRQQKSYFLNFYKRLQGAAFETSFPAGKQVENSMMLSGSVAKGKFTRNIFQGQEGNQGPYRLQGANNEFFFVVLANSERVFLDGELLQRGEDQDYIINYNTAEISFMPKRMITKDRRIQIEFEYADRNYLNINLFASDELKIGNRANFRVGIFQNKDSKASPIQQELNRDQKIFLASLGDQYQQAFYPNANIDTFSAGKILYKKMDTLFQNGMHDSIYVYSNDPNLAKYSLSFIDAGQGNGDYVPEFNGANGKVFRWVAPLNGIRQGRFVPALFLVTPKSQQLISTGLDLKIGKTATLQMEGAMSRYDVNLFATKDKSNDRGFATKLQFTDKRSFGKKALDRTLQTVMGFESIDALFKPLERLRNVEFTRDWGLPLQVSMSSEQIMHAGLQFKQGADHSLQYELKQYIRGDGFKGLRHTFQQEQRWGTWSLKDQLSIADVKSTSLKGTFLKPQIQLIKTFPALRKISLQSSFSREHNAIRNVINDSMASQSFSFYTISGGIQSDEAKENRWGLTYYSRTDAYPLGKSLVKADRSSNWQFNTDLTKNEHHQFNISTTYRQLEVLRQDASAQKADKSLLGRARYDVNEWDGLLTGWLLYEIGAGQEQRRDLAYLEVPAGQGEYAWNDYNEDGIQQLNEFEWALFKDQAKYIKIFTPSNEFVKSRYSNANYNVLLNPSMLDKEKKWKGLRKIMPKLQFQSSMQVSNKELNQGGGLMVNPFKSAIADTSLISLSSLWVNTLSFNRYNSIWGLDLSSNSNSNKMLLTYGYETRVLHDWMFKGRLNIDRKLLLDLSLKKGDNQLISSNPTFGNRNYAIAYWSAEPKISFMRKTDLRTSVSYKLTKKQNVEGDLEEAMVHSLQADLKYNLLQRSSLQTKFTMSDISFQTPIGKAQTQSPVAYLMLEGLLPGKNYLWNIDLTHLLSSSLELNIQYEGRKPGTGRVVHVGRAAIRAIL